MPAALGLPPPAAPRLALPGLSRASRALAIASAGLAANGLLVIGIIHARREAVALGALLLLVVVATALAPRTHVLAFVALAIPITQHALNVGYPLGGGLVVFPADIVLALAVLAWIVRRIRSEGTTRFHWDTPRLLGLPLILFAVAMLTAELRGHYAWGESLIGQPLRFFGYALIGVSLRELDARTAIRGLTAVFYPGTVWMFLNGIYYVATGTSQTASVGLSTGGSRYLSGTVAIYMSAALFLALVNAQLDTAARRRLLHLLIALLALACVILGYFRSVFISVGVILPVLLLVRRVRQPLVSALPLAVPLLLVVGIVVPRAAPHLVPDLVQRVTKTSSHDPNVAWRLKADEAVTRQFHQSPLYGVGFGKSVYITLEEPSGSGLVVPQRELVDQGAHNFYLWMLAGGGLAALSAFALLFSTFLWDTWRRLRFASDPHERVLLTWCLTATMAFLIPELSSPPFDASALIGFWVVLLLPGIVPRRDLSPESGGLLVTNVARPGSPRPAGP